MSERDYIISKAVRSLVSKAPTRNFAGTPYDLDYPLAPKPTKATPAARGPIDPYSRNLRTKAHTAGLQSQGAQLAAHQKIMSVDPNSLIKPKRGKFLRTAVRAAR